MCLAIVREFVVDSLPSSEMKRQLRSRKCSGQCDGGLRGGLETIQRCISRSDWPSVCGPCYQHQL